MELASYHPSGMYSLELGIDFWKIPGPWIIWRFCQKFCFSYTNNYEIHCSLLVKFFFLTENFLKFNNPAVKSLRCILYCIKILTSTLTGSRSSLLTCQHHVLECHIITKSFSCWCVYYTHRWLISKVLLIQGFIMWTSGGPLFMGLWRIDIFRASFTVCL
jgi:hypothetical protein